jgi:hypothetical protein
MVARVRPARCSDPGAAEMNGRAFRDESCTPQPRAIQIEVIFHGRSVDLASTGRL